MSKRDLLDEARDEIERTDRDLAEGRITAEQHAIFIHNINHNLEVDLKEFDEQ